MRLSAKAEYAFFALYELARGYEAQDRIRLEDIAERQGIPENFLVHIMLQLKHAGLVGSKRGAAGGYYLTKSPDQITVGEVIRLFEGPIFPLPCCEPDSASAVRRQGYCPLGPILNDLREAVERRLDNLTFAEVVRRDADYGSSMYHI